MAAKKAPKRFQLWSWVDNNGDGSASAHHTVTKEAAEKKDEAQPERWGESSVSSCTLEYDNGDLYLVGSRWEWDDKAKKGTHIEFRNKLKEIP